ncbi:MAG TPA: orotidine-5'-phosphate decarboxylase, partial [Sphaerochaeta sp.]|nr:orotidine-5'-phosphate decarboxylase [Sphaerochaeta sp.]
MEYRALLTESAQRTGNIVCMGLDPIAEALPFQGGDFFDNALKSFEALFSMMEDQSLLPSAFKPNIGYWQIHDRPLVGAFRGSLALAEVLKMLRTRFADTPVILD